MPSDKETQITEALAMLRSGFPQRLIDRILAKEYPAGIGQYYLNPRRLRNDVLSLVAELDLLADPQTPRKHATSRGVTVLTYNFTSLGFSEEDWLIYLEAYSKRLYSHRKKSLRPDDLRDLFKMEVLRGGNCPPSAVLVLVDRSQGGRTVAEAALHAKEVVPDAYQATKPSLIFELVRLLGANLHTINTRSLVIGSMTNIGEYPYVSTAHNDVTLSSVTRPPNVREGVSYYAFCGTQNHNV